MGVTRCHTSQGFPLISSPNCDIIKLSPWQPTYTICIKSQCHHLALHSDVAHVSVGEPADLHWFCLFNTLHSVRKQTDHYTKKKKNNNSALDSCTKKSRVIKFHFRQRSVCSLNRKAFISDVQIHTYDKKRLMSIPEYPNLDLV